MAERNLIFSIEIYDLDDKRFFVSLSGDLDDFSFHPDDERKIWLKIGEYGE
jgi:hypothetical protein